FLGDSPLRRGRPAARARVFADASAGKPASRHSFCAAPAINLASLAWPPRWLANRSSPRSGERRLVAREGLEPSKPLGRQIYSLLRLTASLPRQLSVCVWRNAVFLNAF